MLLISGNIMQIDRLDPEINIQDLQQIGEGRESVVFLHPDNSSAVMKMPHGNFAKILSSIFDDDTSINVEILTTIHSVLVKSYAKEYLNYIGYHNSEYVNGVFWEYVKYGSGTYLVPLNQERRTNPLTFEFASSNCNDVLNKCQNTLMDLADRGIVISDFKLSNFDTDGNIIDYGSLNFSANEFYNYLVQHVNLPPQVKVYVEYIINQESLVEFIDSKIQINRAYMYPFSIKNISIPEARMIATYQLEILRLRLASKTKDSEKFKCIKANFNNGMVDLLTPYEAATLLDDDFCNLSSLIVGNIRIY